MERPAHQLPVARRRAHHLPDAAAGDRPAARRRPGPGRDQPDEDHYRFCFHWPDEDPALLEPDLASYRPYSDAVRCDERTPWGSVTVPACAVTMMTEGAVAEEAAAIDVPGVVGCGERDVVPDPWAEPDAYRGSRDVSVVVVPRMAHMHNFARTREVLWRRIGAFARAVTPRVAAATAEP